MTLEHDPEGLKQRKTRQFLAEKTANVGKQTHETRKVRSYSMPSEKIAAVESTRRS